MKANPSTTTETQTDPRAVQREHPHKPWADQAVCDLGLVFNLCLFSHPRFHFKEEARQNASPGDRQGGAREQRQKQPKLRQGLFILSVPFPEFLSPHVHTKCIFCNGGSSLTTGRGESLTQNRLLKLSDKNGEEKGSLTGTNFPDNLSIPFIHAKNLLIKSEFRSLLYETCHRNHQILHIVMSL